VYMEVEQQRNDFEMNVQKAIKQFNVQPGQIELATKVDQIAQRRYDVTQRSYLLGRVAILDLNDSVNEKDGARRSYISALHNYWALYYTLRRLTLYDFEKNIPITEDYQLLIK
jgi:Outer membrane protein